MIKSTKFRRFVIGVVDDDTRILDSLEELLASAGHDVVLFSSAAAFLDANGFQQVDCLISDIGMPGMTGWSLLQLARSEHPEFPVILITAREEETSRASTGHGGARYFFRKPFNGPELLAALDSILLPKEEPANPREP